MAVRSTDDNSLFFATGIDNSGLKSGIGDAQGLVQGLASKISRINPFAALAIGAVTAFATISASAYKMSSNFEHAMKEVETISDATQKNFKGISQSVFELTKITPDSPEKLANAYYQIVSAGYDGAKGLKLLETASKAAVAGVTDTKTAADGLTTVLNAFGIESENVNQVADVMFKTVQLGKTTFSELASNLSTVAPIASASGISFEQVAGAVATLTKQGVPTAQAMTQIRQAIIGANQALGDGWSNAMSLQNAFQLIYEKANGSQVGVQKLVGSVEAVSAILGTAGKNAKGAASDLDAMTNSVGASEEAFERMASSNINQWAILRNRIKATTKSIGDAVLEASSGIAKFFNDALEDGNKLEKSYNAQRTELFRLKGALQSVNKDSEERRDIVQQIIKNYPEYLKGIDAEKVTNQQLLTVLDQVNNAYKLRYKYEKRQNELQEALKNQGDIEINIENSENKFSDSLAKLEASLDKRDITLDIDYKQSDVEILSSIKEQLKDVEGAFDVVLNSGDKFKDRIKGFASESISSLSAQVSFQHAQNKELEKATNNVIELTGRNEKLNKAQWDNANNQIEAIKLINKATSNSDLIQFSESTVEAVQIAFDEQKKIIEQFEEIQNVKTTKGLSSYLKSENEEIKNAAKERFKFLNTSFTPTGGSGKDDRTEIERYIDSLEKRKTEYESYENYVEQLGKEAADKRFQNLLNEGDSYSTFLQNELEKFKEHQSKRDAIVQAADSAGARLTPREKVKPIETLEAAPLVLDIKIDDSSYNAITRKIEILQEKARKSQDASEQQSLGEKIAVEKQKLQAIEDRINGENDLYNDLNRSISELNNKELRLFIKNEQRKLKESKKTGDALEKQKIETEGKIQEAQQQIAGNVQETIGQIVGILGEASALFRKFGDEDTAQLLDQLAGVADGIGSIAAGFDSGNPLAILEGGLKVLNSALTVEIVSDTAKFEEAIKELEKAIEKLDYVISKSVGQDKVTNRKDAIKDLEELEKQADLAKKAELEARKEVKFLGIRIGKKGKGSGTSPEKLEELEQKAEDARRKAAELKEQLDELYTGTTQATIVDSIIAGLKEGKRSVADFADNFKDLIQDALLQAFQIKYLEKEIEKFYDAFADAGADSTYTADEIEALRNLYNQMIQGAQDDLDAINQILEDTGIGSLGSEDSNQTGLAGGIEKITEDTANILAGTLNSIRIDVANGLEIAQQSSNYLSQIVHNTSYNHHLEDMNIRLQNIETLLS